MAIERTDALAKALAESLATGLSVRESCEINGITSKEFYIWRLEDKVFEACIARAREVQQEVWIEQNRDIAQSATPKNWQVKRLQIWEAQWSASRLAPRRFGDKLAVGGAEDLGPVQLSWKSRLTTRPGTK